MRENFYDLKQRAALERPTFPIDPLLQEVLLNDNLLYSLRQFNEFGIIFSLIETCHYKKYNGNGDENRSIDQYLYHAFKVEVGY